MRRSATLYGILGLVLIIFGLLEYFFTGAGFFRFFVYVNLIGGFFFLVLWATSSRSAIASVAGSRSARYGANAALYTILFIAILVAVNYVSSLHYTHFDLTAEHIYSLSSQSRRVVRNLKKPIKFYGFFAGGDNAKARQLYSEYAYASPNVSFELLDPNKHPALAEKFKVSANGTTHIQYGGSSGHGTNVTDLTEQAITNAIIRVSKSTNRVVYFLEGHGEPSPTDVNKSTGYGLLKTALEGEGFKVKQLLLVTQPAVPKDCSVLIIGGPERPLMPHEIKAIDAYLKDGGRALVMLRPPRPNSDIDETALVKLLSQWGLNAGNNVVVDQVVRLFAGPALGVTPLVDSYGASPITKDFNHRTVFPMTRSVDPEKDPAAGLAVVPLAMTSGTSWAETNLVDLFEHQQAKFDASDQRGPIDVAGEVTANLKKLGWGKGQARLVVFGSTQIADNQNLKEFFNRDLILNSADWLAGEANQISIRPRTLRASRFQLTVAQFSIVFALSVLLLPELLLIAGIVVWWKRRQ